MRDRLSHTVRPSPPAKNGEYGDDHEETADAYGKYIDGVARESSDRRHVALPVYFRCLRSLERSPRLQTTNDKTHEEIYTYYRNGSRYSGES